MKWLRMYNDIINDPKVLRISDELFRFWVGILCIASRNDGVLPDDDADIAILLRMKPKKVTAAMAALSNACLIDDISGQRRPHNWDRWQFKDDSKDRVRRHRERQRNALHDVAKTAPETDSDSDAESEQSEKQTDAASAAGSPTTRSIKTPWPKDFDLTPDRIKHATIRGLDQNTTITSFDKFRNHCRANAVQYADWDAAWRIWIGREYLHADTSGGFL